MDWKVFEEKVHDEEGALSLWEYQKLQNSGLRESEVLLPELYRKLLNFRNTYRRGLSGSIMMAKLDGALEALGEANAAFGAFIERQAKQQEEALGKLPLWETFGGMTCDGVPLVRAKACAKRTRNNPDYTPPPFCYGEVLCKLVNLDTIGDTPCWLSCSARSCHE